LVLWHREFQVKQEDSTIVQFGAPVKIAYKDGVPTGAAISFAAKLGVDVSVLEIKDLGKGEVLYFKQEVIGSESKTL
ncbi:glycine--tRNA ligase subunit beta, partial [Aliarcobacter butzleri]